MAQGESRLSRAIMTALRARGIYCFKVHGGPFTQAGTPDIIACVPVTHGGVTVGAFVGFETKMPEGDDPTPVQLHQHNKISRAWGTVFVPRSVDDVTDQLNWLGWDPDAGPRNLDNVRLWISWP